MFCSELSACQLPPSTFCDGSVLSPSRGLYLTSIFYRDDNILVTSEDQIPIVEVEDSFSVSLMQDFLWFTKVDKIHC